MNENGTATAPETHGAAGSLQYLLNKDGADFVQSCYREILHREADPEGFEHHMAALESGLSKLDMVAALVDSDEACLNNMATSQLARSARRQVFLNMTTLKWPFRDRAADKAIEESTAAFAERRQALLAEIEATPDAAPVGTQQAVETQRISKADWIKAIDESRRLHTSGHPKGEIDNLWFDLTTAFQWTGGVVGIVRAELEMACGLAHQYPDLRFSMQIDQGFAEISKDELTWLLQADNVTEAYMQFFARYRGATTPAQSIHVDAPDVEGFFHPYENGDAVIAMGWMDSQKERFFSIVKSDLDDFKIFYLIYDIIMLLEETKHFYDPIGRDRFEKYIEWISLNADLIFYGGRTAQVDTEALQKSKGWPTPPGIPVRFGTDIVKKQGSDRDQEILANLGITGEFIITVGSIEPRKNHETLYRAYLMALETENDDLCQLVFIGKPMWRADDMLDTINRNPRLKGKLLCLTPTDLELAALYKNCRFTVLPSIYEGWSLTLPESLGQGKFCLSSDTPPLREIGGDLIDYVDTYDVRAWAEKLVLYARDDALLKKYEDRIAKGWPSMKWSDTAREMLAGAFAFKAVDAPDDDFNEPPVIWMDLTTSFLEWSGGISGIIRAELEYARNLKKIDPRTRFFAYQRVYNYFFEIKESYLTWLLDNEDLASAYASFHAFWQPHERDGTGFRNPFRYSADGMPHPHNDAYLPRIPRNSAVFFAALDSDENGNMSRTALIDTIAPSERGVSKSQLIYDLTPVLTPQFHTPTTCVGFRNLFDHVSGSFDQIIYGGRTAMRDGKAVQKAEGLREPHSDFVEFGSDLVSVDQSKSPEHDSEILAEMGITSDFILTVGTIEPRKNHEVLYKACLIMHRKKLLKKPLQIVFAGKRGWKSQDFLASYEDDERTRGKIINLSPSDEQLDVLYRNCKFTVLPSFYEGWSLTLPESLSYGKLCLTSDVDPLRETGRDLVEYIHPLDSAGWAERIAHYANNPAAVRKWETRIKREWKPRTWRESAEMLLDALRKGHSEAFPAKTPAKKKAAK